MALSFTPSKPLGQFPHQRRRVLVTGASGKIGSYFAEHSVQHYELRLMVHEMNDDAKALTKFGEVVTGNLADIEGLTRLCDCVDTVLHRAASAGPSSVWETQVLPNNIVSTYNMFAAANVR